MVPSERLRVLEAEEEVMARESDDEFFWKMARGVFYVILVLIAVAACGKTQEHILKLKVIEACAARDTPVWCADKMKEMGR